MLQGGLTGKQVIPTLAGRGRDCDYAQEPTMRNEPGAKANFTAFPFKSYLNSITCVLRLILLHCLCLIFIYSIPNLGLGVGKWENDNVDQILDS